MLLVCIDVQKQKSDFSVIVIILCGTVSVAAESLQHRKTLEEACTNTSGSREEIVFQQLNIRGISHFNEFYLSFHFLKIPGLWEDRWAFQGS